MMTAEPTPAKVLTKGQMKRAAREGKVRTRNVLYNPFRLEWPPVDGDAAAAVLAAVRSQLQQFTIEPAVPQAEYTALLAAGDRAAITERRRQCRQAAEPLRDARRRHLEHCVLGFNAASRALESGRLAAILVEADTPALETRFLLPLAASRRCPAVCLPRLRQTLQQRIGLTAAVFGLLQEATGADHHLRPLYDAVCAAASPLIPRQTAADVQKTDQTAAVTAEKTDQTAAVTAQKTDQTTTAAAAHKTGQTAAVTAEKTDQTTTAAAAQKTDQTVAVSDNSHVTSSTPGSKPPIVGVQNRPPLVPSGAEPTPAPFEQADFISLSVPPPAKRRPSDDAVADAILIDTEGVPHKKRLALKQAPVMSVTLGSKAQKKAAKAASKAKH